MHDWTQTFISLIHSRSNVDEPLSKELKYQVDLSIQNGANVNCFVSQDKRGLHHAIVKRDKYLLEYLLENGAKTFFVDMHFKKPYGYIESPIFDFSNFGTFHEILLKHNQIISKELIEEYISECVSVLKELEVKSVVSCETHKDEVKAMSAFYVSQLVGTDVVKLWREPALDENPSLVNADIMARFLRDEPPIASSPQMYVHPKGSDKVVASYHTVAGWQEDVYFKLHIHLLFEIILDLELNNSKTKEDNFKNYLIDQIILELTILDVIVQRDIIGSFSENHEMYEKLADYVIQLIQKLNTGNYFVLASGRDNHQVYFVFFKKEHNFEVIVHNSGPEGSEHRVEAGMIYPKELGSFLLTPETRVKLQKKITQLLLFKNGLISSENSNEIIYTEHDYIMPVLTTDTPSTLKTIPKQVVTNCIMAGFKSVIKNHIPNDTWLSKIDKLAKQLVVVKEDEDYLRDKKITKFWDFGVYEACTQLNENDFKVELDWLVGLDWRIDAYSPKSNSNDSFKNVQAAFSRLFDKFRYSSIDKRNYVEKQNEQVARISEFINKTTENAEQWFTNLIPQDLNDNLNFDVYEAQEQIKYWDRAQVLKSIMRFYLAINKCETERFGVVDLQQLKQSFESVEKMHKEKNGMVDAFLVSHLYLLGLISISEKKYDDAIQVFKYIVEILREFYLDNIELFKYWVSIYYAISLLATKQYEEAKKILKTFNRDVPFRDTTLDVKYKYFNYFSGILYKKLALQTTSEIEAKHYIRKAKDFFSERGLEQAKQHLEESKNIEKNITKITQSSHLSITHREQLRNTINQGTETPRSNNPARSEALHSLGLTVIEQTQTVGFYEALSISLKNNHSLPKVLRMLVAAFIQKHPEIIEKAKSNGSSFSFVNNNDYAAAVRNNRQCYMKTEGQILCNLMKFNLVLIREELNLLEHIKSESVDNPRVTVFLLQRGEALFDCLEIMKGYEESDVLEKINEHSNRVIEGSMTNRVGSSLESDYNSRLKERLGEVGLKYEDVPGDGHCLFHAVGLYTNQEQGFLRQIVTAHLEHNKQEFESFLETSERSISQYIQDVREGREWANHVEIEVLMRVLNRPIIVVGPDGKVRNPEDKDRFSGELIFTYYNDSNHYDALVLTNSQSNGREVFENLTQISERSRESYPHDSSWSLIESRKRPRSSSMFAQNNTGNDHEKEEELAHHKEKTMKK